MSKRIAILGTRGIPANHGGFETFAEHLALYLSNRGWDVTVYCQHQGDAKTSYDEWRGIKRVNIYVKGSGAGSTIKFDYKSVIHSLKFDGVLLTLGYNTAVFNSLNFLMRQTNIINMDGIEWKREKWGRFAKAWFWLNERFGCWFGTHLVADHPRIKDHLSTRANRSKITMIPYGGVHVTNFDGSVLSKYELSEKKYCLLIARAEPENSILEIVKAFSAAPRGHQLVVLGNYKEDNPYHKQVLLAASSEVKFLGAIYDQEIVKSLRAGCSYYIHGHKVGGTNPSLVEALGAGNAVIAHKNHFNEWVASDGALYFSDQKDLENLFEKNLNNEIAIKELSEKTKSNFSQRFTWDLVLSEYEMLLEKYC
jgi:glycosyltransferase involved in cell wall biosynthesis